MKHFLFIAIAVIIYSCNNESNVRKEIPTVLKKYLATESDSFNVRDLDREPSLQFDIVLDTIRIPENNTHLGVGMFFPKLSNIENHEVYEQVKKLVEVKKTEFLESVKNENVKYDTSWDLHMGHSMRMFPKSLYKTEKLVSFSFETTSGYSGGTYGFEFNVVNYDLEKKKQIRLKDYFLLNTHSDTAYLDKIISGAVYDTFSIKKYTENEQNLRFSFDEQYVYFYFDRYEFFKWGSSSVKKKYLLDHINPEYRD